MRLELLREEVEIELENLRVVADDAQELLRLSDSRELTKIEVYVAAVILGSFYTGVENLLLRFLKHLKLLVAPLEKCSQDTLLSLKNQS